MKGFVMKYLMLALCVVFMSAQAREVKGVNFPEEVQLDKTKLVLNGVGVRKYMIFDVYVAGLYLVQPSQDQKAIVSTTTPKKISMHFKRTLDKSKLTDAWKDGFFKNAEGAYRDQYREDLNKLNDIMTFFKDGEVLEITFYPDKVDFKVKDQPAQTVTGADFSKTMLNVFINKAPDDNLRDGLLGKKK